MRSIDSFLVVAVICALGAANVAQAGECCCNHCGGCCECQKVCRLVCEEKKVEVICWGCKCEDFCVPKRSKEVCKHCKTVCAECGDCKESCNCSEPHAKPKRFVWTEWCPGCAKVFTKKKLMKKVETVTVPSFKWVVEDLCPQCEASCAVAQVEPGTQLPTPPLEDAKLLYAVKQ